MKYNYNDLVEIISTLRSENGCPWDRAQTFESLVKYLRSECEEVVQAVEAKDEDNLCEELGDVLLEVLLYAQIAKEQGLFTMDDVVDGVAAKMVRRHPHVFAGEEYGSEEEARKRWDEIKALEKADKKRRKALKIKEIVDKPI